MTDSNWHKRFGGKNQPEGGPLLDQERAGNAPGPGDGPPTASSREKAKVFDITWEVYRRRFGVLILWNTLLLVPATWVFSLAGEPEEQGAADVGAWLIDLGGTLFLCLGAALCMHIAMGHLTSGGLREFATMRSFSPRRLGRVAGTVLLAEAVLSGFVLLIGIIGGAIGAVLLAIPGLGVLLAIGVASVVAFLAALVSVRWLLFLPVAVAENKGPVASLDRSWLLVKGRSWWTLGMAGIVPALFLFLTIVPLAWIPLDIGLIIGLVLVIPFLAVWQLVVYLELRAEKTQLSLRDLVDRLTAAVD